MEMLHVILDNPLETLARNNLQMEHVLSQAEAIVNASKWINGIDFITFVDAIENMAMGVAKPFKP